jgi:hypothetical protein
MTPEELYRYDLTGYLLIEDAIRPAYLGELQARMDHWEKEAHELLLKQEEGANPDIMIEDFLNMDEVFLQLVVNPVVLPYIDAMVSRPRLKSTWLDFKWNGGTTGYHSNHTPHNVHNQYHFQGQIYHNLFQVFYAMKDIGPGEGGIRLVPGSHKANYPAPNADLSDLEVEITMKAGSVLLFTHDARHGSVNTSEKVRQVLIFTYCPQEISNSFVGDTLYDNLFESAEEGSWLKYLLRRPHGFLQTYPKPSDRPYEDG